MDNLTAELKRVSRELGADPVGIGAMNRFEGAPKEWDPRSLFPESEAVVGLAFRIPRGSLRGNAEGTNFYQYPGMGYANINEVYAPSVLHRVCWFLED